VTNIEELIIEYKKLICKSYEEPNTKSIIQNFGKFNGSLRYVAPRYIHLVKEEQGANAAEYILKSILEMSKKFMAILGDYGSGKTSLCHYILYQLCKDSDSTVIPFYIPLGKLLRTKTASPDLKKDIYDYINKTYKINSNYDEFVTFVQQKKLILLLDGLDEVSNNPKEEIFKNNFKQLLELSQESSVVLTSRHTYLTHDLEEKLGNEVIKIEDFTDKEISLFIKLRFNDPVKSNKVLEQIQSDTIFQMMAIYDLSRNNFFKKTIMIVFLLLVF